MPHNRREREQVIRGKYEFVVFDGEYSIAHAILAAVDVLAVSGGALTADFVQRELRDFGVDIAREMVRAGLDPSTEPLYVDKMIFENWESPLGFRIDLPSKFVPYVAARKRTPTPQDIPTTDGGPTAARPPARMLSSTTTDIRHIRGHDWHFAVGIPGHARPAWVITRDGPSSQQQLAFLVVAAAARAGGKAIQLEYERYVERGGAAYIEGATKIDLI